MGDTILSTISISDFPFVCRLCLTREGLKPFEDYLQSVYSSLTNIQIDFADRLPKNVCISCMKKLVETEAFRVNIKLVNTHLKNISVSIDTLKDKEAPNGTLNNDEAGHIEIKDETNHKKTDNDCKKQLKIDERQPNECQYCNKAFKSPSQLSNHLLESEHCKLKKFICSICGKQFQFQYKRKAHMLVVHVGIQPFQCKLCGKKFKFSQNLLRHDNTIHKGLKPYKCDVCAKEFSRFERKKHHERIHLHVHKFEKPDSLIYFSCRSCGNTFTSRLDYRKHLQEHKATNRHSNFKCELCDKIFSSKYALQSHKIIHRGKKDFLCTICGKDFLKKSYLDTHIKIHTGEKPYKCKQCGKQFRQATSYNNHLVIHTGERLYKCDHCDKSFKQSTHLARHKLVHSGIKPYKCTYCDKSFSQSCNLKSHTRIHTGETPFHCLVCFKGFHDSGSMKKHMIGYHKTSPQNLLKVNNLSSTTLVLSKVI